MLTAALAVTFGVVIVPLLGAVLVWAGLRNGDRPEDVRITATLRHTATRTVVRAEVTNPSGHPVMVTMRVTATSWLAHVLAEPRSRGTRILPTSRRARCDAVLACVPAQGATSLEVPLPAGPISRVRVALTAYERPGRVRTANHRLCVPPATLAHTAPPRPASWLPQLRTDSTEGGIR